MKQHKLCSQEDVDSLCVSDDTAAWICGHVSECNFISFRVHIGDFQHPNNLLEHFKFEESLFQRAHQRKRYTYMNYTLFKDVVALKLTVYTKGQNMYSDGLPFFIDNFTQHSCEHVNLYYRNSSAQRLILNPLEDVIENTIASLSVERDNRVLDSGL
jgi:hypothetical protein